MTRVPRANVAAPQIDPLSRNLLDRTTPDNKMMANGHVSRGKPVTCAKCGLDNLSDGLPCPSCAAVSASVQSTPDAGDPISQDFLLGNTRIGLERIRARLLDLTNRNRLLNFRHTPKSSLSIVGAFPDLVFDSLMEGESASFKPVPEPTTSGPKPKVVDYAQRIGLPTSVDLAEPGTLPAVQGKRAARLQTLHYPKELEAILRRISYAARTAIEESGTKMLHLIFGFLEWFESDDSDQSHLAPLLLVPVGIEKDKADLTSGTFAYDIAYSSADQIEENLSLREKLKRDFGLDMPELSDEETPESYFLKFRGILSAKPRWRIRRRITLGLASFGKFLMFRDLDPRNWPKEADLIEHPRITDFFEGSKVSESAFADEYRIDAPEEQEKVPPLIHDADSSQHSALIDALEGKNLIIEGPPGTGKSQTITNLIGLALANGKAVLFVSEKLAALEVVRRRLDQAGLGIFCLELHSHKMEKRRLLDELDERLAARRSFKAPKDLAEKQTLLQKARQQLIDYVELINRPFSALGCTGFDIIWRRERFRQELAFDPALVEKLAVTRDHNSGLADFESDCDVLDVYGRQLAELHKHFPDLANHPWRHVSNASLDYSGELELCSNLDQILSGTRDLQHRLMQLASMTGANIDRFASREVAADLVTKIGQIPELQDTASRSFLTAAANPDREEELLALLHNIASWKKSRAELVQKFPKIALSGDPSKVQPLRSACEKAVEFGLGDFDSRSLAHLATECKSLRAILKPTSSLSRGSLAAQLTTCRSATIFSRIFGSKYRETKLTFLTTFVSRKRPRRKDMIAALHRACDFLSELESDADFVARHGKPLSCDDLGTLIDTAELVGSLFERFELDDRETPRGALAGTSEFLKSCEIASKIAIHPLRELVGASFQGVDTSLLVISDALNTVNSIRRVDITEEIKSWLLYSETAERLSHLKTDLADIGNQLDGLNIAFSRFCELGHINPQDWLGAETTFVALERIAEQGVRNQESLSGWLEFRRTVRDVKSTNLLEIARLAESKSISTDDLVPAYRYVFYNTLTRQLTRDRPHLLQFGGLKQEAARERFVQLDKDVIQLNRQSAALAASRRLVPPGVHSGPVGQLTELGLILQEIGKKKRHIPIRQLVKRAGLALQALKPCFMMGPLSVAQYIEPGRLKFDLVVMDEASQLKPEDALGAIARGGQLVIVGDPKQLPPSTFFERQFEIDPDEDAADDVSAIEEHESILDVARALYQPVRQLRWHYRSRHDSLIAFSNAEFYRNRLLVFPSPSPKSGYEGIQFRYVANGVYESGHAKWNRPEAERVVNSIVNHMQTFPELSLGVVALNFQQRELIDELLTERIRNDDIAQKFIERYKEASEPFFVKNLENVQGDERDVIFISVTYGRDQNGNLFQRFGPINQAQGPRRLNVLFTRAKHKIVVFSSVDPDEIRTDASTSRGVAILKGYLSYAKTGRLDIESFSERPPESDFEIAVSSLLSARGFECVPQIGVAGFFIDIAIRHPRKPGTFILGIECDGASYHSAKSTRDRDRLRQMILENLGWNMHRIWSTDWFKDSRREILKVVDRVRQILAEEKPVAQVKTIA
jgi:very-short-patch-repair endonuclease